MTSIDRPSSPNLRDNLTRLDLALRDAERAFPRADSPSPTALELAQIRRRYVSFRWAVAPESPPSDGELSARLRMIAVGIARLIGGGPGVELPREDQAMLMAARVVVRDFLRVGGAGPERTAAARRLFGTLVALSRQLLRINEHPALLAHDAAVLQEVVPDLPDRDDDWTALEEAYCLERLRPLLGRHPALDDVLSTLHRHVTPSRLHATLAPVLSSLSAAGADMPAPPTSSARPTLRALPRQTLRSPAMHPAA